METTGVCGSGIPLINSSPRKTRRRNNVRDYENSVVFSPLVIKSMAVQKKPLPSGTAVLSTKKVCCLIICLFDLIMSFNMLERRIRGFASMVYAYIYTCTHKYTHRQVDRDFLVPVY